MIVVAKALTWRAADKAIELPLFQTTLLQERGGGYPGYRWLLSGTPVTNSPSDLYTQIEILAPGQHLLGSQESFLSRMEDDPKGGFAKPVFERLIMRRLKEECLDLPSKTFEGCLGMQDCLTKKR